MWSFDANGDTTSTHMSGFTVKHGKFEFVKRLGTSSAWVNDALPPARIA
jgi:hypothetical protein